jgi:signal transduction histidine kinase/pSer/pThr/pTyr-binding forkhead associated (FHA) protein
VGPSVPHLIVLTGPDAGKRFELSGAVVSVGRHSTNAVQLADTRVSRRHLEFRARPGGYQLFDLESGNGTQVNGRTIHVVDLHPGDQIALGETVLLYAADASGPESAVPTANRTRLVVQPAADFPSAVLRTVTADAGSQVLAHPERTSDWLRTRLASLAVLYEATTAVSHILDVDELLARILDLVLQTTGADHGCAMLTDPATGELLPRTTRSRPGLPAGELVVSRSVADHVLRERQGVLVADAGSDERFRDGDSIARHQIREVICVPMKGRHETVGVIFLSSSGGQPVGADGLRFSEDHLTLAVAIAHQAALAIEETRYYQALVQAEKLAAVGQTIAALSHHIKNIMQGVRFGGDVVRVALAEDDGELLLKGWKLVEKNQSRIDDLILDMLSYSKDREPAVEPTALNALAEDVLDVVRGRAAEAGIELDWRPAADLPIVPCDPDGIHRSLLNVLSNALDAVMGWVDPQVSVETGLTADGSFALVTVTDNGPGIPPEKQDDIFKPFVSSKGSKGTGLGLPVSRKILREHGGDVTVESAEGRGCRFTLRIPRHRPEPPVSSPPGEPG